MNKEGSSTPIYAPSLAPLVPGARQSHDPGILFLKMYVTDGRCVISKVDLTVLDICQCSKEKSKG